MMMLKVGEYQRLSKAAVPYLGCLGALVSIITFDLKFTKEKYIYDFDLEICGKLGQKLLSKEFGSMNMIDYIRV